MLSRWQSTIVDERGNVQPLANLTVRNEADQSLAKMWASPGTAQPLPDGMVQADGNGYAYFYAPAGLYRIQSNELSIDWRHVDVGAAVATMIAQQALDNALPTYETLAEMQADTSQPVDTMARVVDDPSEGTNGFYLWDGAAWNRTSLQPASAEGVDAALAAADEAKQSAIEAENSAIDAAASADSVQIKEQEREQIFEDAQEDRENRFNDFIASSGYQFLGDYSSGIEITEYNQIVRDADGEFWRLSGSTELPYTTTGAGLPEGGALAPLGDAVLRQNLDGDLENGLGSLLVRGSVIHTDSVEELVNLDAAFLENGQRAQTPRGDYRWDSATQQWNVVQGAFMSGYLSEWETVDLKTDAKPSRYVLGSVYGKLIAATNNGSLRESVDGIVWSDIIVNSSSVPMSISTVGSILEMSDGEVLIGANSGSELWKSNGWQTNPSTASWSKSVECESYPTAVRFHPGWGIRAAGSYVIASEYGNHGTASNVYLSTDAGSTFSKVFDIREIYPAAGPGSTSHMHGCCVDVWHEGGPRLWVHASDGPFQRLWYSDDLGTTWNFVKDESYPVYVNVADPYNPQPSEYGPPNYVTLDANESGISIGQDGIPEGTAVILRDDSYSANPTVRTASRIDAEYGGDFTSLQYVAQSVAQVGDWFFTLHNPAGGNTVSRPVITATHVASATGFTVWEGPLGKNNLRKIDNFNGSLWVRDEDAIEMIKIPLYQSEQGKRIRLEQDSGDVLGGKVPSSTWNSLAVGRTATAGGPGTIAIGMGLELTERAMLVIGGYSEVSGIGAISISTGLEEYRAEIDKSRAEGQFCIAIGNRHEVIGGTSTVAIGPRVYSDGGNHIVIGPDANATGSNSVIIGREASGTGFAAVGIGRNTESSGGNSIAMGGYAKATAVNSIAIGNAASSTHNQSIALGRDTESTTVNQVHLGNRFIQIGTVEFDPGGHVAGQGQIYFHGPTNRFKVRLPDGTTKTVAFTEDL